MNKLLNRLRNKLVTVRSVIITYRNWYAWFLNYFGINFSRLIEIRIKNSKANLLISNDGEGWMIADEVWRSKIYTKFYEIKNGDVILDIGANFGFFSVYAAMAEKDVRVFSFEPCKEIFVSFLRNIHVNGLSSRIVPFKYGLARREGRSTLYGIEGKSGSSSLFRQHLEGLNNKKINLEVVRLKAANYIWSLSSYYDMVKMDCEGAEYEIFESLGDSISRIGHIVLEYHNGSQMIEKYLQENNFDILEVLPSANPKIGLLWATNLKFSYK